MSSKVVSSIVALSLALSAGAAHAEDSNLRKLRCVGEGRAYEQLISQAAAQALTDQGFSGFKVSVSLKSKEAHATTTLAADLFKPSDITVTDRTECDNNGNTTECTKKVASVVFNGAFPTELGTCSIVKKLKIKVKFKGKKVWTTTQEVTIPGAFAGVKNKLK